MSYSYSRFFSQGALDFYNCPTVFVSDATFRHNGPVTSQELVEYRGDSAGLSVGGWGLLVCLYIYLMSWNV